MSGRLKAFGTSATTRARSVAAAIAGEFGRDEVFLYGGLALVAFACWTLGDVVHPAFDAAAVGVPGAVFVWLALPARDPFIKRQPVLEPPKRRAD